MAKVKRGKAKGTSGRRQKHELVPIPYCRECGGYNMFGYKGSYTVCAECHRLKCKLRNRATRAERGMWIFNYKGGKCADCDFSLPIFDCYDLHHLDPASKEYSISRLCQSGTWATLQREVDKCVMLCANCHRLRHYYIQKEIDYGTKDQDEASLPAERPVACSLQQVRTDHPDVSTRELRDRETC